MLHLGFEGVVVRTRPTGSWINSQYRWAAMDDWVPGGIAGMDPREGAAELVRRWLYAFGPGTTADAVVDGLDPRRHPAGARRRRSRGRRHADARRGRRRLAGARRPPTGAGRVAVGGAPARSRSDDDGLEGPPLVLDPEVAAQVVDRNGNAGPTIWVDGRIVGSWVQRRDGTVALGWLADVPSARRAQVEAAAQTLEAAIGETRVSVRASRTGSRPSCSALDLTRPAGTLESAILHPSPCYDDGVLDDLTLPDGVVLVRTTPTFDTSSMPAGLRQAHRVATGVWGLLRRPRR
ncbi:MAG: crosslink repair DNA glycosylase YcaQ family protein [Acidimicrobiales bacterium]